MVGHTFEYNPAVRALKAMMDSGEDSAPSAEDLDEIEEEASIDEELPEVLRLHDHA